MQEFTLVDRVICAAARAWAQDGEMVATLYPHWYKPAG